jgi:putative glutamine amidotransferase
VVRAAVSRSVPIIGLVGALERAQWSVWDLEVTLSPRLYIDAVTRAGGLPLVIPPVRGVDPGTLLDALDGVLLIGGADIDPESYGAERHPTTVGTNAERDAFEIALTQAVWERELPFLGICRGMQVMNVAAGGTLVQDLPEDVGHGDHRRSLGSFDDADHEVVLDPGSLAAEAAGEEHHATKSHHHQGVDRIGDGLIVTGRAPRDDLPEALERPGGAFALGVQWHPEADETSRVIGAFVAEARAHLSTPAA